MTFAERCADVASRARSEAARLRSVGRARDAEKMIDDANYLDLLARMSEEVDQRRSRWSSAEDGKKNRRMDRA